MPIVESDIMLLVLNNGSQALVDRMVWEQKYHVRKNWWGSHGEYATAHFDGKKNYLHRYIMDAETGQIVDHINHRGLDCRICNLRFCTVKQNKWHQSNCLKGKTSRYKGVCANGGKWMARINGKYKGMYATEEEAALAYDEEARLAYGEFAATNFKEAHHVN